MMKRSETSFLVLLICSALLASCASKSHRSNFDLSKSLIAPVIPHKGAIVAGDLPDFSLANFGSGYWATASSLNWAPVFPLYRSDDLANWIPQGAVFNETPAWTNGEFRSPQFRQVRNENFVYYSAMSKTSSRACVGLASTKILAGPYNDRGQIFCPDTGALDPFPVIVEKGDNYLFWRDDGSQGRRPSWIWGQKFSNDGFKVLGKPELLLRGDTEWEHGLVSSPTVIRRGDFWYMFYTGGTPFAKECNSQIGVARAKSPLGPWQKNPQNPILKENDIWKCPSHGSLVTDSNGRELFFYNAYNGKDSVYVGRQVLADQLNWQNDGWPEVSDGTPDLHTENFMGVKLANKEHVVGDDFEGKILEPGWQWPRSEEAHYKLELGQLSLESVGGLGDPMNAILTRATTTSDYNATVTVITEGLGSNTMAGIAIYGNLKSAIGLSFVGQKLQLWNKRGGALNILGSWDAPEGKTLALRISVREGNLFTFYTSTDGLDWLKMGSEQDGYDLAPAEQGLRIALTAGGPTGSIAKFEAFRLTPAPSSPEADREE